MVNESDFDASMHTFVSVESRPKSDIVTSADNAPSVWSTGVITPVAAVGVSVRSGPTVAE